jgi:chorismate--pyruvate lyase
MPERPLYIHRWTPAYQKFAPLWSNSHRSWLLDKHSLTKRLMRHSQKSFQVVVRKEGVSKLFQHERRVLGCASHHAWVREVDLIVDGQVWVSARSAVPLSTLRGQDLRLRYLGNRPLGHLLFSNPRYQRSQFEIGRIRSTQVAYTAQQNQQHQNELQISGTQEAGQTDITETEYWGRRSIFTCHNQQKTLLVSETFMPVVFSQQSS